MESRVAVTYTCVKSLRKKIARELLELTRMSVLGGIPQQCADRIWRRGTIGAKPRGRFGVVVKVGIGDRFAPCGFAQIKDCDFVRVCGCGGLFGIAFD